MKKITIEKTKGIGRLEFTIPGRKGVYLLVGANGIGKTTILVCLNRICNPLSFAQGFSASNTFEAVDQYTNASIMYEVDDPATCLVFRKKTQRWAPSPKGKNYLLDNFGFSSSVFIKADPNRINIPEEEIRYGRFESADSSIKQELNTIFETNKYNNLMRLRNTHGRGRPAIFFYVIKKGTNSYYSEKLFSTGELAMLRLVETLSNVENNSLVLLDEAELALHPRVQKNLLEYLNRISIEKDLTVIISTHSVTMIKSTDKNHILLLNKRTNGTYSIDTPCYPAKAIGSVDFIDNIIYDAIFFVEDDMARLLLKKMLKICCEADARFHTVTNCIVPVGGYEQTAALAINTRSQVLGQSRVFAVWDADVFSEVIPSNQKIRNLYENNRSLIFSLGCTPEMWMIEKIENYDEIITNMLREQFRCELRTIITSQEYTSCTSPKPRKLAKLKMDVIVNKLSAACGDPKDVVLDRFAQILIDNAYDIASIREIVFPMLAQI